MVIIYLTVEVFSLTKNTARPANNIETPAITIIALFGGFPMAIIVIAGVSMLIAGLAVFFVKERISIAK